MVVPVTIHIVFNIYDCIKLILLQLNVRKGDMRAPISYLKFWCPMVVHFRFPIQFSLFFIYADMYSCLSVSIIVTNEIPLSASFTEMLYTAYFLFL